MLNRIILVAILITLSVCDIPLVIPMKRHIFENKYDCI